MPDTTPILSLPLILPAQAQKHVTHNEALKLLDIAVQLAVLSRTETTPPTSPVEGDCYIPATGAVNAWAGEAGKVAAWWNGAWVFLTPREGWAAWVVAEETFVVWRGTAWSDGSDLVERFAQLGVNAAPDATNRLSVATDAVLFNHAGTGVQVKLNKAAAGDTASLLYQTGFSGRAELGLAGTNDFSVKVSADGSAWTTALVTAGATGIVTLPAGAVVNGSLTGTAVTQSATDATAGRLLKVGDHGLAAATLPAVTDLNAITTTGWTRITSANAGTGNAPTAAQNFVVETICYATDTAIQRATRQGTAAEFNTFVRNKAAGTWGAWRPLSPQAFGFGGATVDKDANSTGLVTEAFRSTTNASNPDNTPWHVLNLSRLAEFQSAQIAVRDLNETATPFLAVRHRGSTGIWAPWNILFGRRNLLGTVSQTSGLPTGAVIERGSNANGEFVRFADGTQICTRTALSAANASTAVGALFRSADATWTFPASFAAAPAVTGDVDDPDAWAVTGGAPTTTSVSLRVLSALTKAAALNIRAMAVGRWF